MRQLIKTIFGLALLLGFASIVFANPTTMTVAFNVSHAPEFGDESYEMTAYLWRELGNTGSCSNFATAGGTFARDTHDLGVFDVSKDLACDNPQATVSYLAEWNAPKQTICSMTYDKKQGTITLNPDNVIDPGKGRPKVRCHARMMGSHLVLMVNDLNS